MADAVERYRRLTGRKRRKGKKKQVRPSVPTREWALVGLLLANVLFLAFALGGVRLWGQSTALGLAVAGLFLLPRWSAGELEGTPSPVFRLLRSPVFYLGLGLYTLFWIHSWNLAWDWTTIPDGRPKLISQTPPVPWLPAGLESPLTGSNPFRSMMFYAVPWLSGCCAWAGLTTRRSVAVLLHGLTLLGVAYAGVALYQHFTGAEKVLGIFDPLPSRANQDIPFWGTLMNGNHAAFFLILINGLCLGLFLSGWHRALRMFQRGGGAYLLYLACSLPVTFSVLLAQARGAIIVVAVQWLLFLLVCSLFFIRHFGARGTIFPVAVLGFILFLAWSFVSNPVVFERQKEEWTKTFSLIENPELEARTYMYKVTRDMVSDQPWYGHGAGSFRYLHFPYLAEYPEFKTKRVKWTRNPETGKRERRDTTLWFQNAHVDLMEYLVEWGIVGCIFPVALILYLLGRAVWSHRGWDLGMLMLLLTFFLVFGGAAVEFHLRIPLVLLGWWLSFLSLVRLGDLRARALPS